MKYKLSDLVDIIGGGTPKKSNVNYWNGNIPWASIKDLNGKFINKTNDYITQLGLDESSANLIDKMNILISARGTVGNLSISKMPMAFNQSIFALRVNNKNVNVEYLYYFLKSHISQIKNNVHGSVFDTITKETFTHIYVDLPKIDEQLKIVKILGSIDQKIINNNDINDNLLN